MPWHRLESIVYVLGFFHFKMAAADAIHHIFIAPQSVRHDPNGLFQYIGQIWPKETGNITNRPGFHLMHEVIQHVGIVSQLQCWWQYVREKLGQKSLGDFAASKPTWEELVTISKAICIKKVGNAEIDEVHRKKPVDCDQTNENCLIHEQYFLLYEEITYAMNTGDISWVESCFVDCAKIFKGCGKHKYATELI